VYSREWADEGVIDPPPPLLDALEPSAGRPDSFSSSSSSLLHSSDYYRHCHCVLYFNVLLWAENRQSSLIGTIFDDRHFAQEQSG